MKVKYNASRSWEKQSVFDLENGWRATVEFNPHYGSMISRLDSPGDINTFWHCSNGIDKAPESAANFNYVALPEFARPWVEEIRNAHGVIARLVRPCFVYEN